MHLYFRNIGNKSTKFEKNVDVLEEQNYLNHLLGTYIKYHNSILDLLDDMERILNKLFLFVLLGSVMMMCLEMYQINRVSNPMG